MPVNNVKTQRCFVDTNVWLYAFITTSESQKLETAKAVVKRRDLVISTQVVNETCVNLLKKAFLSEEQIRQLVRSFYEKYIVVSVERQTLLRASELREQYSFSYWDSVIVAAALGATCRVLYTEDMQNGLEIAGQLTIVNPFQP